MSQHSPPSLAQTPKTAYPSLHTVTPGPIPLSLNLASSRSSSAQRPNRLVFVKRPVLPLIVTSTLAIGPTSPLRLGLEPSTAQSCQCCLALTLTLEESRRRSNTRLVMPCKMLGSRLRGMVRRVWKALAGRSMILLVRRLLGSLGRMFRNRTSVLLGLRASAMELYLLSRLQNATRGTSDKSTCCCIWEMLVVHWGIKRSGSNASNNPPPSFLLHFSSYIPSLTSRSRFVLSRCRPTIRSSSRTIFSRASRLRLWAD